MRRRGPLVSRPGVCYDARTLRRSLSRLWILGATMEAGYLAVLAATPTPSRTLPFLVADLAVFVVYLAAVRDVLREPGARRTVGSGAGVRRDASFPLILAMAGVFRLTFLAAPPVLSQDLYRYLWDGRVTLAGGNPYLETPAAARRSGPAADADLARIDHADVPTIYPPAAQGLFAAGAALGGVLGIRLLLIAADLLVAALLASLLRSRDLPPSRALIYAWNPLAVTETAWSGHLEPAAILFVLLAARAIIQKRDARAALALTAGGLVKLFPLVLFAPFARSIRGRVLILAPLLLAAACLPFSAAGARAFAGLHVYADRWLGNESLFALVLAAIERLDPTPALKGALAWTRSHIPGTEGLDRLYACVYPIDLAKGVCGLAVLAVAIVLWRRRVDPLRGAFVLTGAVLLLSPTAHPWYFLWVLPWLCLFPSLPFLLLTGLVALSYVNLGAPGRAAEPYPWIRLVEYGPFYVLLSVDGLRRALRGRTRNDAALAMAGLPP